jgi:hypothetical protein
LVACDLNPHAGRRDAPRPAASFQRVRSVPP